MKKALIFDMDGVIIDSEKYWQSEEFSFIKKLIPSWSELNQQKIVGLNLNDIYSYLVVQHGVEMDKVSFIERVEEIAIEIYKNKINLIAGFKEVITSLKGRVPLGLGSSAKKEWIEIMLNRFDLVSYFNVVLSADEIEGRGKPAPDLYLEVARQLGVHPVDCVVIEDSHHGISAAKAAGMTCVGFRTELNLTADLSVADLIIEGYKEFDRVFKILDF